MGAADERIDTSKGYNVQTIEFGHKSLLHIIKNYRKVAALGKQYKINIIYGLNRIRLYQIYGIKEEIDEKSVVCRDGRQIFRI